MTAEHFDLAVIGGGKGGKTLAADFARSGRRVVMIERGLIGGSCINVACIPTKTLVRCGKVAEMVRRAEEFGVRAQWRGVDPVGVRARKRSVVAGMVQKNQENFDQSGMTFLLGEATFVGPKTVEARLATGEVRRLTADDLVINTGTRPALPAIPGLADAAPLTSESLLELDRLPDHLLVLGGGYIGCEFAQLYRRFGSRVTLIDRGSRFLPREDADIAETLRAVFQEDGIDVILSAATEQIEGRSGESVRLRLTTPEGPRVVEGSDLLVALGRLPNTEGLNLTAAGVATDARGFVTVTERLETTAARIWAVGDVTGGPQFTHISLDDSRILKANLTGGQRTTTGRLVPYTLFTDPELGRVGLTEDEARKRGLSVKVARLPAAAIPRARTTGETRGLLKVIVDASTDRILGVAILAPEGGEVMTVVQMAMQAGLTAAVVRDTVFAHPTMAEALNDLFARLA